MRLTNVLMDGGRGLNILYASTLDMIGIPRSSLSPSKAPFYGIIPGKEVMPLGYLKLKMLGPKGVITVKGSFEQAYYCEQDCVAQAATLVAPYVPDGPDHNAGRALAEGAAKAAMVLDRLSIGEASKKGST
ncbi:uncharacterized protein [Miscanthus floridulus]|uniref:uncharacterized protein n=1 Tax=Miscanthus floridulus TaxID=154761 RepID=UPI003459303C